MILPPSMLGMLGGGQLARFFVIAAHEMGYRVTVLDPDTNSPAGKIADKHLCAAYDDANALREIANTCAAVTTEFENVPAATLQMLAATLPVHPSANAVAICQHRINEKNFLHDHGFPHAPYAEINDENDLPPLESGMYPGILKVVRFGYDGKGQARVNSPEEALVALTNFRHEPCVLEKMLMLDCEVSVVLARDAAGHIAAFPTAENIHRNGILDISIVPARASAELTEQAQQIARGIAEKLGYIGTLGVEFFIAEGKIYVNEMAPRPHNSGHYTLDACVTNQFEQQVRALCGLPLGDARLQGSAVMVNLLGDAWRGEDFQTEPEWLLLFAYPNLKLHLYGKQQARLGRKMGHFTMIATATDVALRDALAARRKLGIGEVC